MQITLAGSLPATLPERNNATLGPECRTPAEKTCQLDALFASYYISHRRRSSKPPALATHSDEHLLLFHGPTVAVHYSVTGIPHCRPSVPNFLQLTAFRVSKTVVELPAASSTLLAIPFSRQLNYVTPFPHQDTSREGWKTGLKEATIVN